MNALLKYGEIALRGKNRGLFENRLMDIVRKATGAKINKEQGRFLVKDIEDLEPFTKIIGISAVCPVEIIPENDMESLKALVLNHAKEKLPEKFTFKIVTKRANKNYPFTSPEINTILGGHILENIENARVDVNNPEHTIYVELRNNAYVYSQILKGVGGLPSGAGRAISLLSGGIDSPVATFLTARRGLDITPLYFHAPPYTTEHAKQKVIDICKTLSNYTGTLNLHIINFTDIQLFLHKNTEHAKLTIFLKRAMVQLAEELAKRLRANALIMGDSIGQVASQTIQSIQVIDDAAKNFPIIRPLATNDKQEIIDIAKKIGTYDISIRPFEDCCTIFVAKHPETKPDKRTIRRMEARIKEELTEKILYAVEHVEIMEL
ncbi:MAG: tRNA 4-thiouridine(8) synthase ThiI [Defluviitaleaceae bacterium]|nr:tRNA 4-thiouridine(8) synthase ThiI [Defluviitaleaceae bacterium]